ncbi:MAG: DUF1045 domain-containing protein [Pseudomonadota bacterium]
MPTRYALYFTPAPGAFQTKAAQWLGWDSDAGQSVPHPDLAGVPEPIPTLTETPRKYGFHGTLKAPFRLAADQTETALIDALDTFAATRQSATIGGLKVAALGRFLALIPDGDATQLADLTADIVTFFEPFRAPLSDADIAKRRASGLTPAQDALMLKWGYPYVMDEFRFHMTLTGALAPEAVATLTPILRAHFADVLTAPFRIDALSLLTEEDDGRFHLARRIGLGR